MSKFSYQLRVRYCDTDHMAVVYHAKYLDYLEWARTEFIRQAGTAYDEIEKAGYLFPCIDLSIQYKKPAVYDQILIVELNIRQNKARFVFDYTIFSEEKDIIAYAESTHVVTNKLMKACKAPDLIKNLVD